MKKLLLFICFSVIVSGVLAQWTTINIGNTSTDITSLSSFTDSLVVGFAGDGIFKSNDVGNTWTDISGDLPNKNINRVVAGPWPFMWVCTNNGAYYSYDQATYINATTSGLNNTDISYYSLGGDQENNDFIIGTNGGGFYYGPELEGPWTAANNSLSGDALTMNEMGGYDYGETSTYMLATQGGIFYSYDEFATWNPRNNGLTGDRLHVTGALLLETLSIITTESGLFSSMDDGLTWTQTLDNEKFNTMILWLDPTGGFYLLILGQTSYYTNDLANWLPISTPGEVIDAAITSDKIFVATVPSKSGGVLYSQPIDQVITGVNDQFAREQSLQLKQNNPNPFTGTTTIFYELPGEQNVDLRVYDLMGREVKTLFTGWQGKGNHHITLDGSDMISGIYTVVLKSETQTAAIKIILE